MNTTFTNAFDFVFLKLHYECGFSGQTFTLIIINVNIFLTNTKNIMFGPLVPYSWSCKCIIYSVSTFAKPATNKLIVNLNQITQEKSGGISFDLTKAVIINNEK
jgi:hypothetical protein